MGIIRRILHVLGFHWWAKGIDDESVKNFKVCRICALRKFTIRTKEGGWRNVVNFYQIGDRPPKKENPLEKLDLWNLNQKK